MKHRMTGKIRSYDAAAGCGVIRPDLPEDVFFDKRDLAFVPENGQRVVFTVVAGDGGGSRAADVRRLEETLPRGIRAS